ncbi:MAG: hypothetical protein ACRDO8_02265 [Nocardioidaceae bacterium]
MSAVHGPARARKPRTSATRRTLNLVPRPQPRTPRTPFVALVVVTIVAGLVGLLVLNTAMQKNAFELARLQGKADTLTTREAALRVDVEKLSSPAHVADKAGDLGMVPNTNPVFLRLSDGKVIGKPVPAVAGTNLPGIAPPGPTPQQVAAREQKAAEQKAAKKAAEKKAAEKKAAEKKAADKKAEHKKPHRKAERGEAGR